MITTQVGQIEMYLSEIEKFPLFSGLDQRKLMSLLEGGKLRASKHRELLYRIGDQATSFSLVLRGAYKLVRPTSRGEDVIVYFSSPGDVIAALVMAQPKSLYPVSAVAMGPSLVLEIPKKSYQANWAHNSEIVLAVQNLLYSRMVLLQDEKLFNRSPLNQKVANLLLQLMEKYSGESDGILPIPLTRKEIADSLGASVESVIRIMSDWSHHGIISTAEQHIEILEPSRVVEFLKEG